MIQYYHKINTKCNLLKIMNLYKVIYKLIYIKTRKMCSQKLLYLLIDLSRPFCIYYRLHAGLIRLCINNSSPTLYWSFPSFCSSFLESPSSGSSAFSVSSSMSGWTYVYIPRQILHDYGISINIINILICKYLTIEQRLLPCISYRYSYFAKEKCARHLNVKKIFNSVFFTNHLA